MRPYTALASIPLLAACTFAGWGLTASDIIQRVEEKYESLMSFSAEGKTVSIIDASETDFSQIESLRGIKDSKELKEAMSKPQPLTHTFTVRLGRPGYYRIEWEQKFHAWFSNKGAVWSAGEGDFLILWDEKYSKSGRDIALASATGVSGGAAHTIPFIFFKSPGSLLKNLNYISQQPDETIDNIDCYVIAGSLSGQRIVFWISKQDYLIRQKQTILGGGLTIPEPSEEDLKEGLRQLNKEATPEAIAEMKKTMQNAREIAATIKGTLTESYHNIVLNQPVVKSDYEFKVSSESKPAPSPVRD